MSVSAPVPVLIVGAGPTGLFMACELLRHGVDFRIIDKNPAPSDKSKALGVHARSLEIFEAAGIVEPFLEQGETMNNMVVYAGSKKILKVSLDTIDSPYPYVISLPQSQTEAILAERLAKAGKEVERNCELESLVQEEDRVTAQIKKADGTSEKIQSLYLLGCDGCHSKVRKELNINFPGNPYDEMFMLADVSAKGELNPHTIYIFNSKNGLLALFPYKGGRYRVIASLPDMKPAPGNGHGQERPDLTTTLEEIQAAWDARASIPLVFSDPIWLTKFAIHHRLVAHYRVNRVFIGGDASHVHSPMGGQGMNTGLQDSHNLAWKLALVLQRKAHESILASYEAERLAIAQKVVHMTDFLTKVNTIRNPVAVHLRNTLAPILVANEAIQSRLRNSVAELDLNYRHSPIVEQTQLKVNEADILDTVKDNRPDLKEWFTFKNAPQAGDRAPDALLEAVDSTHKGKRIFSLLQDPRHQLLLFSGANPNDAELESLPGLAQYIEQRLGDRIQVHAITAAAVDRNKLSVIKSVIKDENLAAHRKYGADSGCLYLLRPDGYIGYRSQPANLAHLLSYLSNIFTGVDIPHSLSTSTISASS